MLSAFALRLLTPALERQAHDALETGSLLHQAQLDVILLTARTSMST